DAAFYVMPAQKLKNDIFRADPIMKFPRQLDSPYFWHFDVKRLTGNGHRNIYPACPHRKHAHTSAGTRMTVRSDQCFAWFGQSLHMYGMTHTIPRPGVIQSEALSCTSQK